MADQMTGADRFVRSIVRRNGKDSVPAIWAREAYELAGPQERKAIADWYRALRNTEIK